MGEMRFKKNDSLKEFGIWFPYISLKFTLFLEILYLGTRNLYVRSKFALRKLTSARPILAIKETYY